MNSLPLSEWKLRMTKGNCWRMLVRSGISQASHPTDEDLSVGPCLVDARRGQHHFPLRELIDGVDVVDPLPSGESPWCTVSIRRKPG